jgi:predicted esterase
VTLDPAERHLAVARTARYWILGDPTAASDVWFVLHGYGQLARRFLVRFGPIDHPTRCIVAPEGLSRFYLGEQGRHGPASRVGATWMTREDREHEIDDYVRYLDGVARDVLGARRPGVVTVLGFSQGVATACRWTVLGALRPERLLLWGDFLPPDLDLARARAAWRDTEVVLVRGAGDPTLADPMLADAESGRAEVAGLALRLVSYPGGHEIDPTTLRTLAAGAAGG